MSNFLKDSKDTISKTKAADLIPAGQRALLLCFLITGAASVGFLFMIPLSFVFNFQFLFLGWFFGPFLLLATMLIGYLYRESRRFPSGQRNGLEYNRNDFKAELQKVSEIIRNRTRKDLVSHVNRNNAKKAKRASDRIRSI